MYTQMKISIYSSGLNRNRKYVGKYAYMPICKKVSFSSLITKCHICLRIFSRDIDNKFKFGFLRHFFYSVIRLNCPETSMSHLSVTT